MHKKYVTAPKWWKTKDDFKVLKLSNLCISDQCIRKQTHGNLIVFGEDA
jgi:hypothetical protein